MQVLRQPNKERPRLSPHCILVFTLAVHSYLVAKIHVLGNCVDWQRWEFFYRTENSKRQQNSAAFCLQANQVQQVAFQIRCIFLILHKPAKPGQLILLAQEWVDYLKPWDAGSLNVEEVVDL